MIILTDGLEKIAEVIRTGALVFLGLIIVGIVLGIIKLIIKLHQHRQNRKLRKQLKEATKEHKTWY